ncbi:BnaCnng74750D [Brassica napus]|uniref:BnaCnng74750D protein n=2 Tax=Brassica TaxID=3705 RepID=A0A078JYT6_BRANA|nr:BnaCnng74750D [Brassica napus]
MMGLSNLSLSRNNKFTVVGCNALALLMTYGTRNHSAVCLSTCDSPPVANGECNGEGCCSTDVFVPLDSNKFHTLPTRVPNMTSVYDFNPCKDAFLGENGTFHFNASEDLKNLRNVKEFPVLLDWSIGNQRCDQVGNRSICCMNNSICVNSTRGTGYNCKCFEGFEGNPYLSNEKGCQGTLHVTLQENSGILTDIPTENEILGISRGISEETQNWVPSEFPRNIPTEFRGNINPSEYSEEITRKNVFLGKNR